MIQSVRRTLHPSWYQGHGKGAPYFEGWYYKVVDALERHRLAIIPGIFEGSNPGESHAFVQVLDGITGATTYHEYPVETFQATRQGLHIDVGPNSFTLRHINLQIESRERCVKGALSFSGISPWPSTLISPGVMGWFSWVPLMQTYHGVISLDHAVQGALTIDDEQIDFDGGRGYIEKDWGRSFPEAWIWTQTNHFDHLGTSFTASIATIPLLGFSFRGLIIGLWHKGKLYRFATYTGAKIEELSIDDDEVRAVIVGRDHHLAIRAFRARGGILRGPTGVDMGGRVPESLRATVNVHLSIRKGATSSLVFEGTGRNAGLEVVGDRAKLLGQPYAEVLPSARP